MKRILAVFLMLAILLAGMTVTATADTKKGWQEEEGVWHYYNDKGEMVKSDWVKGKDGKTWYYLQDDGAMAEDDVLKIGDKYYAFKKGGAMVADGWYEDKMEYEDYKWTNWYYAGADGALTVGWKQINGKWYYFYGAQKKDKALGIPPVMATGIVYYDWDEQGPVPLFDNGAIYAFKDSGEMIVGWGEPWGKGDGWIYTNADGTLVRDSWKKIDGKWYYFGPLSMFSDGPCPFKDGKPAYEWSEDVTIYCFDKSGAMKENGWYELKWEAGEGVTVSTWFYCGKDGAVKKGWFKEGGKWYYSNEWGGLVQEAFIQMDDGKWYFLKKSGEMAVGWEQVDDDWYYFKESGAMVEKDWVKSSGKWYYLKEYGVMARNETLTIDGKEYTFGDDGAMK